MDPTSRPDSPTGSLTGSLTDLVPDALAGAALPTDAAASSASTRLAEALGALGVDPLVAAAGLLAFAIFCLVGVLVFLLLRRRREALARDGFAAVAAEALQRNSEGFLALAGERLRAEREVAAHDLAGRHKAIEDLVGPLQEALTEVRAEARVLERERSAQANQMGEQLRSLVSETSRLSGALRAPGSRGRWGELTLRRTVELAGLVAHCDFAEQVKISGAGSSGRPDMLVRLPAGREIAVDAKVPLEGFLQAAEADADADRLAALDLHACHLRRHVDALAGRDYASQLERTPEFVVLFLPGDAFLSGAVERDRDLVEYAMARGVVLATPATLYALLAAVAQGWREARLTDSSREILALAREMDDRLGLFTEHLGRLGTSLGRAVEHYNAAIGSFESRVLPQARRIRERGVDGRKDLEAAAAIDTAPRPLRDVFEDATTADGAEPAA